MSPLDALVGISISEPADSELATRGVTLDHVHHAYVELARQILASGGALAYGGNPQASEPNYVRILLTLLHTYSKRDRPPRDRIQIYLAAPIWRQLTTPERARMRVLATLNPIDPAEGEPADPARDFTAMRVAMTDATDARVIIGGRLRGPFAGRWPGIIEEAYLTLQAGKPLFVAGGLGGAAALVADLIRGHVRPDLELADAAMLPDAFLGADLRNGLHPEENALLLQTADLDLLVALILRGLLMLARD